MTADSPDIRFDPRCLAHHDAARPHLGRAWSVMVVSDRPELAAIALKRAGERWMSVVEDGRELNEDEMEENLDSLEPLHSAADVSDVLNDAGRPWIVADCQGSDSAEMAATYRRIVEEELVRAGVTSARVEPDSPSATATPWFNS